jgi:hypothetical protein
VIAAPFSSGASADEASSGRVNRCVTRGTPVALT